MFAIGGNETTPNGGSYSLAGQPQSGIWFGKTDDLWQWGKPSGWGGPWRKTRVTAGAPSDPFLMTGFDKKVLHVITDKVIDLSIEVDFLGDGTWVPYQAITLGSYAHHEFPSGFTAQWVRLTPSADCVATAEFMYT